MEFKSRITMVTMIVLLLVPGVGGGLSGSLTSVFAAEEKANLPDENEANLPDEDETITPDEGETALPDEDETITPDEGETASPDDETVSSDGDETGSSDEKKTVSSGDVGVSVSSPMEMMVPIHDYDILNVLVPMSYAVAFNPYGLNVRVEGDDYYNGQVISRNYGIVNASTRDKLVTVTLTVEDLNDGQITFVDSAEAARDADAETFAIYLALVPADDGEITVNNRKPNKDITSESLIDVSMGKSTENAVALQAGENQVIFKLSGAVYDFLNNDGSGLDDGGSQADSFRLMELAADGTGVTAFTFDGAMNPDADWTKLQRGIRLSVVYTYENTTGTEMIAEGTGAMVKLGGE